jgi:predicted AAA+ superfamily ATPase
VSLKEFILHDGTLQQLPNPLTRDSIYIAGPSGSGKTTYAANYIKQYKRVFKKGKVFVFSRLSEDPALDALGVNRIIINEELVSDPISPDDLKNSLVLFDDIDTIPDKNINESVRKLRDDILETGRHQDIYVISTSHQLMNYKHTRTLLNEATSVTFFTKSGSSYHTKRFLKEYCGLGVADIQKILSLPSRWVTIFKHFPMMVLYSSGCYLLS